MRAQWLLRLVTVMLLATGCGGGVIRPPPVTNTFTDPTGDEFGTGVRTDWDGTTIATTRTSSNLTINITFTSPPSIPLPGSFGGAGNVTGFVDLDVDQNAGTGAPCALPLLHPLPGNVHFGGGH